MSVIVAVPAGVRKQRLAVDQQCGPRARTRRPAREIDKRGLAGLVADKRVGLERIASVLVTVQAERSAGLRCRSVIVQAQPV